MMELKEIKSISYANENFTTYSCKNYFNNGYVVILNKNMITILQRNCNEYEELLDGRIRSIKFMITKISITQCNKIPTKLISNLVNAKNLFNLSTHLQKQQLLLEPLLLPNILQTSPSIQFISVKLSPEFLNNDGGKYTFLLNLTNFGYCEIRYKQFFTNEWKVFTNLSNLVTIKCMENIKNEIQSFERLKNTINSINITAICWNSILLNNKLYFVITMANGQLYIYNISYVDMESTEEHFTINDQLNYNLNINKVIFLKWYTFYCAKLNQYLSYLIVSDSNGLIILYRLDIQQENLEPKVIHKIIELYDYCDSIKIGDLFMEYLPYLNSILIVTTKGSHLLIYIYNLYSETIIMSSTHNFKTLFCTGIHKSSTYEYTICTLDGHVKLININIDENNKSIEIIENDVKMDHINFKKYALYGITGSRNNVLWTLNIYPYQPIDHLILRLPAATSVCAIANVNIILDKITSNITFNLQNYYDCFDALNALEQYNIVIPKNFSIPQTFELNEQCLYMLKVRLLILNNRIKSARPAYEIEKHAFEEHNFIKKTVLAILAYKTVTSFIQYKFMNLTDLQKLSIKCHRILLLQYSQLKCTSNEAYSLILNKFVQLINDVLEQSDEIMDIKCLEKCVYCNETIAYNKLECKNNHDMARCCISMIQVPLLTTRCCPQCKLMALDDLNNLQVILNSRNAIILCPLCDMPLEFEKFEND